MTNLHIYSAFSPLFWFYILRVKSFVAPSSQSVFFVSRCSSRHFLAKCVNCSTSNSRRTNSGIIWRTQRSIYQLKRQIFPSGVGENLKRELNIEWIFDLHSSGRHENAKWMLMSPAECVSLNFKGDEMPELCLQLVVLPPSDKKINEHRFEKLNLVSIRTHLHTNIHT